MKRFISLVSFAALLTTVSVGNALAAHPDGLTLPKASTQPMAPESAQGRTYVGSEACKACHKKDYTIWKTSWHANMHRDVKADIVVADFSGQEISYTDVMVDTPDKKKAKISPTIRLNRDGEKFSMTLIDKDDTANNQTWPIAYVFGGNWNQHFEARVGDAAYPTPMRWVVEDGQWTTVAFNDIWWIADGSPDGRPRKTEEMPKTKTGDATCDGCHTTGYSAEKNKTSGRWVGQRIELGIGCESCHGPGSVHVDSAEKIDIVNPVRLGALQQDQLCGQCHSRVTNKQEKELSFPLGFKPGSADLADRVDFWNFTANPRNFWANGHSRKNRQQLHDVEFSKHRAAGVTCVTCHDSHTERKGVAQVRMERNALCSKCHEASAAMFKGSVMADKNVRCADCHMAKIANRSDSTAKTRDHWDSSAHSMAVFTSADAERLKIRSSCESCHAGTKGVELGEAFAKQQSEVHTKLTEVEKSIAEQVKAGKNVDPVRKSITLVVQDKAAGAHNPRRALALLNEAVKALSQ
ncbi:multiheme c-type cytochrome [Rhodoferax sp.]|uniref:multiheme c-type cytochrome n=1 Tax=Rhodoferax sp. TaxID=50421 RepID=UPI00374DEC60